MVIRPRGRENVQYKAKERDEFFRRLDRGGTIRAVAAELGLSVEGPSQMSVGRRLPPRPVATGGEQGG